MTRGGLLRASAFVLAVALLFPLQASMDARRPKLPSSLLYTPDRRLMKVISCGHGPTLADLVWVQSTNYVISEFKQGKTHIEHMYALYDVMTELDPNFVDAYVTGAIFLSSIAEEPDRSIELLEKGHGRLEDVHGDIALVTSGRVDPEQPERWRLLHEMAATHLVSLAGYAPTLEERYDEIRLAGRMYLWAAKRYPRDRYPTRPDYYEDMGHVLATRAATGTRTGWYYAVGKVWEQRLYFTPRSSPLYDLYKRRLLEISSRVVFEGLAQRVERWKAARGAPSSLEQVVGTVPEDPLQVGYFLVDGKAVAPALDAALIERQLARVASGYHRDHEKYPASLDELMAEAVKAGRPVSVPPWVHIEYDPATGEVRTLGGRPR